MLTCNFLQFLFSIFFSSAGAAVIQACRQSSRSRPSGQASYHWVGLICWAAAPRKTKPIYCPISPSTALRRSWRRRSWSGGLVTQPAGTATAPVPWNSSCPNWSWAVGRTWLRGIAMSCRACWETTGWDLKWECLEWATKWWCQCIILTMSERRKHCKLQLTGLFFLFLDFRIPPASAFLWDWAHHWGGAQHWSSQHSGIKCGVCPGCVCASLP